MNDINIEGGINPGKIWKMKQKMCPRVTDPTIAKTDKFGNLVTTKGGIKKLYEETKRP